MSDFHASLDAALARSAGPAERFAAVLYVHREGALTCYDHPPTPEHPAWCCVCGAHDLMISWRAHVAAALAAVADDGLAERVRGLADRWERTALDYPWNTTIERRIAVAALRAALSPAPSADRDERDGA